MKPRHPKYKIKQDDTLESITQLFGVEKKMWLRYHNSLCRPPEELIREQLPKDLAEIYLLPELWEKEDELNFVAAPKAKNSGQPIVLHLDSVLFNAPMNFNHRYGVIFQFPKDKMHFEIDCIYTGRIPDDVYQITINREQVYINEKEPDSMMYEAADKMAKAVYPLVLHINRERKIEEISNYTEIVERCEKVKEELPKYYAGEYAEKHIGQFEKHYNSPNDLINCIENDLFYQLFFLPIQGLYENLQKTMQHQFVFGKNGKINCNVETRIEPTYTESGKLVARVVGTEMQNNKPCFEAEYRFYPEDNSIFSIVGYLTNASDEQEETASRVDFEIYHLNPEKRVFRNIIPKYKMLYLTDEKTDAVEKKRSFWDMFS